MRAILLLTLTIAWHSGTSQELVLTKDLQQDWYTFDGSGYIPYQEGSACQSIYFTISAHQGTGDYLRIQSTSPFSVFLNHQLLIEAERGVVFFSVDSLRYLIREEGLLLAVHKKIISKKTLSTELLRKSLVAGVDVQQPKPPTSFGDFIIVAALMLLILLVVIIRLNPKLAADYFSVTKIFSLRESEDSQVYTRITSSGNFLFYGFSSLTIGFLLLLLFRSLPESFASRHSDSFLQLMVQWTLVSGIVGAILMGKMLLIYLFAILFRLLDVTGFQFFNWVRLLFLAAGSIVSLLMAVTLIKPDAAALHIFFYGFCGWILIGWLVLAFFKIAAKARIGLFHLFSYLCATEIIPSLILLKILYY
jgi:hypothetical protein